MSGRRDKRVPSVPDEGKLSEEKFFDSGCISGEIHSEELTPEDAQKYMRLDSGVDLSESFSGLNLKTPGCNDLAKSTLPAVPEPPVVKDCDDLWQGYFQQDEDGDTFLHLAIAQGFVEVVLALIRKAPHPLLLDTLNDNAQSPIHLATAMGHSRVVRWLVVAGAKPSPRNIRGDSPLHIAARNGDILCCEAITKPVQEHERIALGLSYPKQPYQQPSLDQWNYEGQTCAHLAAIGGHVDVLRHLVRVGVDVNARDGRQGYAPLHYAVERGDERLAHFLLTECSTLNAEAVTYGGRSALQLGFQVPATVGKALRARGVPSPFSSDDDDESDSESESYEGSKVFLHNLIDASA